MTDSKRQYSLPGFDCADREEILSSELIHANEFAEGQSESPESAPLLTQRSTGNSPRVDAGAKQPHSPLSPLPSPLHGQTVWIIDGHSLIHQVFHALPEMSSPRGEPVGAVFGFTRDMLYLLEEKRPDYLFCAFDLPGKTFRHVMYAQYKIQRPEMDADLVPQIASIRRVLSVLGIPAVDRESFEADDVMATVARIVEELGGACILVTADKDCRQLITDRVKVYNIRKNEYIDREALKNDWGIAPEQVVDFQALVGDSVDNVPGVPKVGPKTARQLIEQFGTLDAVLERAAEVKGAKLKENLLAFREQALLSRELVRLDNRVPLTIDWNACRAGRIDRAAAVSLFRDFGFRGLTQKVESLANSLFLHRNDSLAPASTPEKMPESFVGCHAHAGRGHEELAQPSNMPTTSVGMAPTYHLINTPESFGEFLVQLREQKSFSFDTETTDIRPRFAELVGLSFAWNDREAWYLPVRGPAGEPHLDLHQTLAELRPILENPATEKIGQNLKYDILVLRTAGVELRGAAFDSMIADYLLDAGRRGHNLDDLALSYLGHKTIKISELIGSGKHQKRMDEVPLRQIADYAAEDAIVPLWLKPILAEKLEKAELEELFTEVELPLIDVLVELEFNGIKIDPTRLANLREEYGRRLATLEEEIHALAGRAFNIASPKQLQEILFNELKLPVLKKTPKTGPSTDAEVLEELAPLHPLPAKLVEFRQYAKLKSTYIDALPTMVHPETGRIHASFNQVVAATGRLSSSDPNLQNIPVRTAEGREIRSAFVPGEEGWLLLAADYSQIELRVLAHFSGDEQLCEAFARDEDIHARVASQVNHVPLEAVTPSMRRGAKAVNFGVIYGQSAFGLAKSLGIEQEAAQKFIDNYFASYPRIEKFMDRVLVECRKTGYVKTILGRRRAIEGIREHAGRQRNLSERTAVNTVIQGSAADLMKLAMVSIHRRLCREKNIPARMLLQIHDELIFEVPATHLFDLANLVREEMVGVRTLNVPLKVDLKAGPNWADAEEMII
ncbi:MAG: DNA polymerase I [Pirellulales bacterium]|nr:DNA polymerase I [Pirellulales bacterium]